MSEDGDISRDSPRPRWRRWLTLAEILAVVGLILSGLTLWNNIEMRRGREQDRAEDKARTAKARDIAERERSLVSLNAAPVHGGAALTLKDMAGHAVQNVTIQFPSALGIAPKESLLEPTIRAEWVADTLLDITDGGPDAVEGRLPVAITSDYWDGDRHRRDTAIYDVVFVTEGRVLRGRALRLRGIVLRQRIESGAGTKLAALWRRERRRLDALKSG